MGRVVVREFCGKVTGGKVAGGKVADGKVADGKVASSTAKQIREINICTWGKPLV